MTRSTEQQPLPIADSPEPADVAILGQPRRVFVVLAVLASIVLTAVAVTLIGLRWSRVSFPDAVLIARGDDASQDTEIVVRSDEDRHEVARARLTKDGDYECIVMVERGQRYSLRATLGDRVLMDQSVAIPANGNVLVTIHVPLELRKRPTTQPATQPAPPETVAP
jgi:hypothetical protein